MSADRIVLGPRRPKGKHKRWAVTVKAFGHTRVALVNAPTRRAAEEMALRSAGFKVESKEQA